MGHRPLQKTGIEGQQLIYNHGTISVHHVGELQGFIDQLDQGGKLSDHETHREYIRAARCGRNNISHVEGIGTFLQFAAFVTNDEFPDEWTDIGMMSRCETCRICLENCPTGAIRERELVIDAGKCLPLYNEAPWEFPNWIPADAHNAYIGCMMCQLPRPANREVVADAGCLPDISEEETRAILGEESDDAVLKSAGEKLRIDLTVNGTFQVVSRNIKALLRVG